MQIINSDGTTAITYPYTPNGPAAYIFITIFAVAAICHIFYLFRLRAAYFIPFVIGIICEAFGYYGRSWSSRDQPDVKPYVLQYLLILPAPVFLAASIYMSLGRIATALDAASYTMIRPSRLAKLFVFLDFLCFAVQLTGAGMESTTDQTIGDSAGKVVTAGVILQLVFTAWFLVIASSFHRRLQQKPTAASEKTQGRWRLYLAALYLGCGLIMLRNLVRAVQELQGFYGFVNSHEACAYVFDAVPMATVVCLFVILHPSRLIRAIRKDSTVESFASSHVVEAKSADHQGASRPYRQLPT